MKKAKHILRICLLLLMTSSCKAKKEIQLFDGQTLYGWEGSKTDIRIENGVIIGGNLEKKLDNDFYLCTTEAYSNFELTLSARLIYNDIMNANAGVYFRAKRTKPHKVGGYEADIGFIKPSVITRNTDYSPVDLNKPFSLWGSLLDECRADTSRYPDPDWYPGVGLKLPKRELIHKLVKPYDWNEMSIIAIGKDIEIKVNGITTIQYTEKDDVASKGVICLQAHSGAPYEVHYKNINIKKIE